MTTPKQTDNLRKNSAKYRLVHRDELAAKRAKFRVDHFSEYKERLRFDHYRRYKITPLEYDAMLKEQEGRCAICGQTEARQWHGKPTKLAIDHDHVTGKVRALLCHKCNVGIGALGDSPNRLLQAREYLQTYGGQ